MVGCDILKQMAGNRTNRTAVYKYIDNMVAGIGLNAEVLATALVDRNIP